jgi:HPt (histidine-containing phosphotransfer) domain-containing protein
MQAAGDSSDFARLAELAHWLKGAGGTVGFDCFTAPAGSLEQAAKSGEQSRIEASLSELQSIGSRIVVSNAKA